MTTDDFERELAGLVARAQGPAVDVDPAEVVVAGRRVRRRRAAYGSSLAVVAVAGVAVAGPFAPRVWGPAEPTPTVTASPTPTASPEASAIRATCLAVATAWLDEPIHPSPDPTSTGTEVQPPVNDLWQEQNRLSATMARYPDVVGDVTLARDANGDVYEVEVVTTAERAPEFEAAVRALDLPLRIHFVPAVQSAATLDAAIQELNDSGDSVLDVSSGAMSRYPRLGCVAVYVGSDRVEAWEDRIARLALGVTVVVVPRELHVVLQ